MRLFGYYLFIALKDRENRHVACHIASIHPYLINARFGLVHSLSLLGRELPHVCRTEYAWVTFLPVSDLRYLEHIIAAYSPSG